MTTRALCDRRRGATESRRGSSGFAAVLRLARLGGLAAVVSLAAAPLAAQSTHVLVVTGLGGEAEYSRRFAEWGRGMADAATAAGVPAENVTWLAEASADGASGVSRRDAVVSAIAGLAGRSAPGDLVVLALFGHGSARGDEVRINLPGPDLTAGELAALLDPLADRRVVVVNAASASGGFVGPLSRPGRVVITATRSTRENQATRFGGYFVRGLAGGAADTDKDGRVSMLEAFEFARLEVARAYSEAGQLSTEHALLDDNGDGLGTLEPGAGGAGTTGAAVHAADAADPDASAPPDGRLAATLTLGPAVSAAATGADSTLAALRAEEARLRTALAALRARQDSMAADEYRTALERLLLEIARNGRAIREAEGGGG